EGADEAAQWTLALARVGSGVEALLAEPDDVAADAEHLAGSRLPKRVRYPHGERLPVDREQRLVAAHPPAFTPRGHRSTERWRRPHCWVTFWRSRAHLRPNSPLGQPP